MTFKLNTLTPTCQKFSLLQLHMLAVHHPSDLLN
jgi:hypothetical protein